MNQNLSIVIIVVGSKPCVVHRDVNSNNVLVTSTGHARLADLGLAQALHHKRDKQPSRITEVT
jgi:serine/threonine protein kinase